MVLAKTLLILCLVFGLTSAEERTKRQTYNGNYGGAAQYRQQPYQQQQGYQQQPQAYGGQQTQSYGHQPQQYAPQQPVQKPPRQHGGAPEEEKEQGPHPLTLLLENSKFECGAKSDGYYADSGVGCQAFHYCVSGQKHSMMCPAGTVFHQVHLNCVPQDQDICNKADKFFFVNDYLNKPLEQKGPNNTVVYAHRYYPENYAVGDEFIPPQEQKREPPAATYGLGPAYREQQPAPVHQNLAYRPQTAHAQQIPAHQPQPAAYAAHLQQQAPVHRPHNPAPYTPPAAQGYQHRPVQQPARPVHQPQAQLYGFGAQQAQAYSAQQQHAQRAFNQQQQQAQQYQAPPNHLYGASAAQRPRYAQEY